MSDGSKSKAPAKKRGALGRGLNSLMSPQAAANAARLTEVQKGDELKKLPIDSMVAGRYQPRKVWDDDKLAELAESIKTQGVIQPIVVRDQGNKVYEIIAGERRWRASKIAGLAEIPAVIREVDDRTVVAMALIENIQREDLNPMEEAQALFRLIEEFSLTHQQAAETVGRSRASVSNLLRLLDLPDDVRAHVEKRELEMGHARAMLPLAPQAAIALAKQAVEGGFSVREVEHRVQQMLSGTVPGRTTSRGGGTKKPSADIEALERELAEALSTKVNVLHGRGGKGRLILHYGNLDTLDGLLARLRGQANDA